MCVCVCTKLYVDTKASEKLIALLTKTRFLKDLTRLSPLHQTSSLESYHSVVIHYAPKSVAFSYSGMKCRYFSVTIIIMYNDLLCEIIGYSWLHCTSMIILNVARQRPRKENRDMI